MKKYASVIIDISIKNLDRPFTYLIPAKLQNNIEIGSVVNIPFGSNNRKIQGFVVDFLQSIDFEESKLKSIISINQSVGIESELIKLAYWMKKRYVCTMQTALRCMIPSAKTLNKKHEKIIIKIVKDKEIKKLLQEISDNKRFESRKKVLQILLSTKKINQKDLLQKTEATVSIIKGLERKGIIKIEEEEVYRNPFNIESIDKTENLIPNYSQQKAIYTISMAALNNKKDVFLLHGITGSGKTEVYMQIIEQVIENGKQAIVLIPEISLTPQTVNRFIGRFGKVVGVIHSKLSAGEKYDQWRKAKEGNISIMIGARSAIFTPFNNLGIIIIDEEHEMTYKSEMPPKYHAREVAIKRGSLASCPVVLGSATPLVETYYKALEGKYHLLELQEKAVNNANLNVELVDMRSELLEGNKSILSRTLKLEIEKALKNNEQVILFINRRGHSNFVSCRKCGYVLKCPNCEVAYTYHSANERMICHYCGKSIKKLNICPICKSKYIKEFGIGTQKVEKYMNKYFPNAKILRMDFDTTIRKNSYEKILEEFKTGKVDILIGTQMIAKGHDFENVTVVGVLAADLSLHINDYRACERTFQLITQVTGRTGRGRKKGKAIIQTYSPEHYSIISAKEQNYKKFYENEILFRKMMDYPPFSNILIIILNSENEKKLIKDSYYIKDILVKLIGNNSAKILGPTQANIYKIKNNYRYRIIIKSSQYSFIVNLINKFNNEISNVNRLNHIGIQYDINPMVSH